MTYNVFGGTLNSIIPTSSMSILVALEVVSS